jgi:hypothetical protein
MEDVAISSTLQKLNRNVGKKRGEKERTKGKKSEEEEGSRRRVRRRTRKR